MAESLAERNTSGAVSWIETTPVTENAGMSRTTLLALAGAAAIGLTAGSLTGAQAAPLPALNAAQVGGPNATVDTVQWRGRGYGGYRRGYYGRGYGYRRGIGAGGALAAGAALGLIGSAIAASAAPRYGYYDGYYGAGYGYPAYGYSYPAYGYGYPAYYGY